MLNLGHFHFIGKVSIFNKRINFTEGLEKNGLWQTNPFQLRRRRKEKEKEKEE